MADERINKVLSQLNELETLSSQKWEKGADWRNEFEPALPPLVEESGGERLEYGEYRLLGCSSNLCAIEFCGFHKDPRHIVFNPLPHFCHIQTS